MCSVVINSCKDYYKKTVQPLMESLEKANVPKDSIFVVVGDCDKDEEMVIEGVAYIFRRYCNIDNNGILWLTQEKPSFIKEWVMYLHDTSLVAPEFWKNSTDITKEHLAKETTCLKLYGNHSMSMGFYKREWLYSDPIKEHMKTMLNYDINNRQSIKNDIESTEDALFKYAQRGRGGKCIIMNEKYDIVDHNKNIYGTNTRRIIEFYKIPGLYKIKANFGPPLNINL